MPTPNTLFLLRISRYLLVVATLAGTTVASTRLRWPIIPAALGSFTWTCCCGLLVSMANQQIDHPAWRSFQTARLAGYALPVLALWLAPRWLPGTGWPVAGALLGIFSGLVGSILLADATGVMRLRLFL